MGCEMYIGSEILWNSTVTNRMKVCVCVCMYIYKCMYSWTQVYKHLSRIHLNSVFHISFGSMYALGHCPFGRPVCDDAITSWLMSWDVASIYPHNFPPSWCHLFVRCTSPSCSNAPPQHDAATPVFHIWDGVLWLASLRLFTPNIRMVIMAKQFYFCFIRPNDISPKGTIFFLMCSCKP